MALWRTGRPTQLPSSVRIGITLFGVVMGHVWPSNAHCAL